ncbi:MAG: cobalt ECF transporter T component CbiQ [Clostridiales bacterium]|nr:cobalt ECF transporter T component CbiQ [Clostridiales bacterium]MCF8022916.1 cobalt ECF transporter T component CbiQ [Clostridiales bacterium]
MKIALDSYHGMNTIIHRWEPRTKFIALMLLIFAFSFVKNIELIPVMIISSFILYTLSRLPFSFLLSRLCLPGFFIFIMLVLLLFLSQGTVLFKIGPLAVKKEGLSLAFLIAVRFICIITIVTILFATSSFVKIIKVMRSLGLPPLLAEMMTFTYRYIFEIGKDLMTMLDAMKIRGFKARSLKDVSTLSSLAGTIFVRSYDQSDRVYSAMVLRGYGQPASFEEDFQAKKSDIALMIIVILTACTLTLAQIFL